MEELVKWLDANKISYKVIDSEVVEIEEFGKIFLADLTGVQSIFRGTKEQLEFNLMENPKILMEEGINYVAFPFGRNWYYFDLREEFRFNLLKYIGKRWKCECKVPFVNLGVHTPYELLNGSGDISLWVKKAQMMGHTAIGICDQNTMAATLNLQKECAKAKIKHVFGYSFTLEVNDEKVDMKIYCQTQKGLRNLLRIQKEIMVDSPINVLSISALLKYAEGNVLVLGKHSSYWISKNIHLLGKLGTAFNKVYYQVDLSEYKADRIDAEVLNAIKYFFDNFYISKTDSFVVEPILISDNYYLDKDDARNKIILNKIASGAAHKQSDDQYFKDMDEHYAVFKSLFDAKTWNVEALFKRMCSHTLEIAENATAKFELGKMYMPQYIMLDEEREKYSNRRQMFRSLLEEGLKTKVSEIERNRYRERLEEEIYIIESTNNVDYFLMQWDMVSVARRRGIVTGIGRGSAGGSLVSYLLGIISIDPIKYDLLFSRFLVPERCGLNWADEITVIGEDIEIGVGESFIEIKLELGKIRLNPHAKLHIKREDRVYTVYARDLRIDDEILLDNRDILWTLNDILL